jgi:hypothetical protein
MASVTGDGNREGEAMGAAFSKGKRGQRRGGSTVPEVDNTVKVSHGGRGSRRRRPTSRGRR